MAHFSRLASPANVRFSKGDKFVLDGADLGWECDFGLGHVLVDVFARKITSFSSSEIVRMMAVGAMTVARPFYEAPS